MLSSEYIHEKILDTNSCSSEDVRKLAELMELYPYVSSFSILYLKALANSKDVRLEREIEKNAYKITSRAVLYDLLQSQNSFGNVAKDEELKIVQTEQIIEIEPEKEIQSEKFATVETNQETIETEPEIIEDESEIIEDTVTSNEENQTIQSETIIEEEATSTENYLTESVVETEYVKEVEVKQEEKVEEQVDELQEVIVENQIDTEETIDSIDETQINENNQTENPQQETYQSDEPIVQIEEKDELEQMIQSAALSATYLQTNFEDEEKNETEIVEINEASNSEIEVSESENELVTIEEDKQQSISSERSFSSWLQFGKSIITEEDKTQELEIKVEESTAEIKKVEYYNFDKPKKEFYSPVKKAKESLSENNMPVSETLAKIFALQGNYQKSIYVYEQLILIFPEKKSFFATQIKNLKKKINS